MFLALALSAVLSQSDASPAATVPPSEQSAAERTAAAAEKAAAAAQAAAEAARRIADMVAPVPNALSVVPEKKKDVWIGSVGAGLTFITGNSQTLTLTGTASADRKWEKWALGIRLNGAYGLANPDTNASADTSVTARRGMGTVRLDRTVAESFASIFALAGMEFDHMKNIETRSIGEAGAGLTFFNKKEGDLEKFYLRVDLAMRAGYETRFQYFPRPQPAADYGIVILAPRAALTLRWSFSKDVRITEELEAIPFLLQPDAGRFLLNNTTKLSARLTETLSLSTSILVNFDSKPPAGADGTVRKSTDTALTVGLDAVF